MPFNFVDITPIKVYDLIKVKKERGNLMTIVDNKTINDNIAFKALVASGDQLATWSVETECNSYADDEYNGTYEEAKAYAVQLKADHPDMDIQMSLISLDADGCTDYTYEIEHID